MLLYLASQNEDLDLPFGGNDTIKSSWKGYEFYVLNESTDKELIFVSKKSKRVTLTDEGRKMALELINIYFSDREKQVGDGKGDISGPITKTINRMTEDDIYR